MTSCDTLDIYETVINGNGGVGLSIVQLEQHIKVISFTITNFNGIYYGGQDWNWRYDLYFSNCDSLKFESRNQWVFVANRQLPVILW